MKNKTIFLNDPQNRLTCAVVTIFCLLLSSCTSIPGSLSGFGRDETAIRAEDNVARIVKSVLMESDMIEAAPLRVSVEGKVVTLKGFVESVDESTEAERLTRHQYPEYQVVNEIAVR